MSLTELLRHVGIFGGAVIFCLALLSVFSVGMIIEKHRRFSSASGQSEKFKPEFKKFLHGGDVQNLIEATRQHQNSHVAQVVSAGIAEYDAVAQNGGDPTASLELVTSALRDSISETLIQLKRGLGVLATIGSTAPFIGLFGTVVGIINAFRSIAATGSGGMSVVSGGIAEALVSTALGIFVAIPAVVAFNHFTGKMETFHVEMNRASSQLVNRLFKIPELKGPSFLTAGALTSTSSTSSPLSSGILNKRFTSWDDARFISTWKVSILPVKWLKATTAGIATKIPKAVETRASAMPPETTDIPPDPVAAMLRKALIIPTTVPKRPTKGAVEPIVARNPRPRFS